MIIGRTIKKSILSTLSLKKIAILYGPRQAGKTTLAREIASEYKGDTRYVLCDESDVSVKRLPAKHLRSF